MNRTKLLQLLFLLALVGSLGLELVGEKKAMTNPWDYPAFFALTGLVGCLLLAVIAKGIVSPALDRPQDFYETDAAEYDEQVAEFEGEDR
jgi:hypothetical protein